MNKITHPKRKLFSVRVYFPDDIFLLRLEKIADVMGLSVSGASGVAIRYGLPEVEKMAAKIESNKLENKQNVATKKK